jgi:hypothetical protein
MIRIKNLKINKNSEALAKYQSAVERSLEKLTPEQRQKVMEPTVKSPALRQALNNSKNPIKKLGNFFLQLN